MEILKTIDAIDEFIKENKISMLYFSSKGCNVCASLFPKIEELLKNYSNIKAGRVEIDKLPIAMGKFSIFTLPCILIFVEGKEFIREARFISISDLEEKIERFYFLV